MIISKTNRFYSAHLLTRCAALCLLVGTPATTFAQSAEDQSRLERLFEEASATALSTISGGEGSERIIAAWQVLRDAAQAVDPDHPHVARADIRIAAELYNLGRNEEARAKAEAGLARIPANAPDMLVVQGEGVALLGTILAHAGEAQSAISALREGYDRFTAAYDQLPADEIGRGEMMAKSNLEFSLSQTYLRLSDIEQALSFQRMSLDTREGFLGPTHADTVASYYGYAGTLRRAGQMEEAERFARIAATRAVDHVDPAHPSHARALEMLAIVLSRSGRPIEATDYLSRALELKRKHEGADSLFFGYGLHQLGTILHQREKYADSVPLFLEAAPIFARYQGENSPFGLGALAYAAQGEFALGREDEALSRLIALDAAFGDGARDLEITQRIGPDLARGLIRKGETAQAAERAARDYQRLLDAEDSGSFALHHARLIQQWAQANVADLGTTDGRTDPAAEAAAMLEYLRRKQSARRFGALEIEHRAALDLVMEIALTLGNNELMAGAVDLITRSDFARADALRSERLAADDEAFANALRALQDAEVALDAADRAMLRAIAKGENLTEPRAQLDAARTAREAAAAQLGSISPNGIGSRQDTPVSIAEIRAGLARGEAVLAIATAYDGAYSLLITPEETLAKRIPAPRAELVTLAQNLRNSAANAQFDAVAAQRMGELLFNDNERETLQGIDLLRIVAGGQLASLPFGIIQLDGDHTAASGGGGGQWLADRFALANAPSLSSVQSSGLLSQNQGEDAGARLGSLVAFASPTRFGEAPADTAPTGSASSPADYFTRSGLNTGVLAQLPALPLAVKEARMVAAEFERGDAIVWTGAEASEARLTDAKVSQAEVLLFATHGMVAGEIEGIAEPALVLAKPGDGASEDGVLTASEIAQLNLSADWVILTACDSAAGFSGGTPAFSGLVSAFRFAGGGSLLATHWKVRDDIAAYVAVESLRHYRQHGDKARALRHALAKLRKQSGLAGANDPSAWGPFVLVE